LLFYISIVELNLPIGRNDMGINVANEAVLEAAREAVKGIRVEPGPKADEFLSEKPAPVPTPPAPARSDPGGRQER
jgi:hypothetical protein